MKALKIGLIVVTSLMLVVGAGYLYASNGIKSKPGYVKLATLKGESVSALLSVNLGPGGVKPVRWLLEQFVYDSDHGYEVEERVFNSVLQELQGVQLRVYDVGTNRPVFDRAIADSVVSLKEKSWQTLATVRQDDVKIAVLKYGDGEQIVGLSIMASTPDKALFLNLIGPFDTAVIAEAANQMSNIRGNDR